MCNRQVERDDGPVSRWSRYLGSCCAFKHDFCVPIIRVFLFTQRRQNYCHLHSCACCASNLSLFVEILITCVARTADIKQRPNKENIVGRPLGNYPSGNCQEMMSKTGVNCYDSHQRLCLNVVTHALGACTLEFWWARTITSSKDQKFCHESEITSRRCRVWDKMHLSFSCGQTGHSRQATKMLLLLQVRSRYSERGTFSPTADMILLSIITPGHTGRARRVWTHKKFHSCQRHIPNGRMSRCCSK